MNAIPVHIRRPDPDETPLSAAEQLIAISRGFHSVDVSGVRIAIKRAAPKPAPVRQKAHQ